MSYVTPQQQQQPYPTYTPQGQPVYYAQPVHAPQPVIYAQPQPYQQHVQQPYQQHVQQPYQQQQPQQPVYAAPVRHAAAPTPSTPVLARNAGGSSGGGPAVTSDGSLSVSSAGGYRDAKWAILFILYMLAYLIPGFVLFNKMTKSADTIKLFSVSMSQTAAKMLAAVVGIAAAMSLFWLLVARHRPRGLIYFALWTSFALTVIMAILCISSSIFGAIILFIIAAFQLIFIVTQRKRIAFAAKILSYSVACVQKWPATILTAFGSILFTFGWYILWLIAAIGLVWSTLKSVLVYQFDGTYETEWHATNTTYVAYIHIVFALYWATQVIKNVLHVTVAGVMASWYFLYPVHAVKNPTAGSLKRALTTSFGSICLGSLLVAILRTIRAILSYARNHQGRGGLAILLCVLQCIFDWFDAILVYFNQYAYAQVAIYGKTYMHSARATWELFKVRGFDALVNDTVIGNALTMAAWLGGLMTAIFSGLVAYYVAKTDAWLMWAIIGLLLGFAMTMITLEVVDSAVICLFVCLAEDPAALQSTKPEIYNDVVSDITNDYPNISFSRA